MTNYKNIEKFGPDLETASDLLQKLEFDFKRVQSDPRDTYAAFDFFITAEHMVDWTKKYSLRKDVALIRIASALANSAKHFKKGRNSVSVEGLRVEGAAFQKDAFRSNSFQVGSLIVTLREDEAQELGLSGQNINVIELAERVILFWRENVLGQ